MPPALIPLRETLAAAARFGADAAGVADTARLASFPASPPDLLSHYTRAVVLGIRLDDLSPAAPEARFRADCARLDEAALAMACWVQARGGLALPVPASLRPEHQGCGLISHKEAAAAAGLGWISPTGLLATHAFGPRLRLVTVLAALDLEAGSPVEDGCGDCRACARACPAGVFDKPGAVSARLRRKPSGFARCRNRPRPDLPNASDPLLAPLACGACLAACPMGRAARV